MHQTSYHRGKIKLKPVFSRPGHNRRKKTDQTAKQEGMCKKTVPSGARGHGNLPCQLPILVINKCYTQRVFVAPNPRKHCGTRKVQQRMCRGISCPCTPHTVAVVQNTCLHIKTKNRITSEVTLLRPIIRNSGSIETRKGGQTKEMMESRYFPKVVTCI